MGSALGLWQAEGTVVAVTTWGIAIGSYGIALAMTLAAATGSRGLVAGGPASNHVVYAAYKTGVPATLIGTGAFLWIAASRAF
jgi:hypothetical protein